MKKLFNKPCVMERDKFILFLFVKWRKRIKKHGDVLDLHKVDDYIFREATLPVPCLPLVSLGSSPKANSMLKEYNSFERASTSGKINRMSRKQFSLAKMAGKNGGVYIFGL